MTRIIMRAGKDPRQRLSHEQSLAAYSNSVYAGNAGNMLFYSSVHRALSTPDADITPDGYVFERSNQTPKQLAARINGNYDHYMLPLANAFRKGFVKHLDQLTSVIEKLRVPVTVPGVGAQMAYGATFDKANSEVVRSTKAFVSAVLDRAPSIGVRGEYTADFLRSLGFADDQIDIIGCPSLFFFGKPAPMVKKTEELSPSGSGLALNYTPYVPGAADFLERNTDRFPESVVLPQRHTSLTLMLWGDRAKGSEHSRFPDHPDHPLYLQDRLRQFVDASTWIEYLSHFEFVTGNRIHGNVAGVLAGTPSKVLAHDSRTSELADYHGIPWERFAEMPADADLRDVYADLDLSSFERKAEPTFKAYTDFLDRQGLEHIFQDGKANPAYDDAIRAAGLPGPVHTLMAEGDLGRRQVIDRLSWLRQSHSGDQKRPEYAAKLPMGGARVESADLVRKLEKSVRELEATVSKLSGELSKRQTTPRRESFLRRARRKAARMLRGNNHK